MVCFCSYFSTQQSNIFFYFFSIRNSSNTQVNKLTLASDESALIEDGPAPENFEVGDGSNHAVTMRRMESPTATLSSTSCFSWLPCTSWWHWQTGTGMCPCDDVFISFTAQYISDHALVWLGQFCKQIKSLFSKILKDFFWLQMYIKSLHKNIHTNCNTPLKIKDLNWHQWFQCLNYTVDFGVAHLFFSIMGSVRLRVPQRRIYNDT